MRRIAIATLVCLVAPLVGCDATPSRTSGTSAGAPTAAPILAPTPPADFGLTWGLVADVERPEAAFTIPSDLPTAPTGPGTAGHPGHFRGQSILRDVTVRGDLLVAVGYTALAGIWTADAWASTDGRRWQLSPIDTGPATFAEAVTTSAGGGFVAVGRAGAEPAAWTSTDGRAWTRSAVQRLTLGGHAGEAERMVSLLSTPSGLLAGGSAGPELGDRRARFWRSADGVTWTPIADDEAFEGGEVVAIAMDASGSGSSFGGLLALGRLGTGQRSTASVAWTSADGETWARHDDAGLRGGLVAAVVGTADGWLAVGSDGDEREAVAWGSADGQAWQRAATEASRLHAGEKVRMTDVISTDEGYIAVGNFVGVQFGEGTSWRSADGITWQAAQLQAALGQGEPEAVTAWRDRLVIVGSRGAPDDYIPSAWISPNVP